MSTPVTPGRADQRPSIGELVSTLSEQLSRLIRSEIQLAKVEVAEKAKHAGLGAGLFAGAALMGFFGFALLLTTAVLGLSNVVPAWLAALIVAVVLFVTAGVLALIGKKALDRGVPPAPVRAQHSVKADVAAVKEGLRS
jgi:uncharacterized membrane protein YqjE